MAAVGPGRRPSPRPPLLFSTSSLVGSLPLDFVRLQLRETGRQQQQQQAKEKLGGGERRGAGGLVEESRLGHDSAPKATTATMDDDTLKVEMFFFSRFFFFSMSIRGGLTDPAIARRAAMRTTLKCASTRTIWRPSSNRTRSARIRMAAATSSLSGKRKWLGPGEAA